MSSKYKVCNVFATEAVQSLSCTRHTGTESSAPHENESSISKPSSSTSSQTSRMEQPDINLAPDNSNSCVSTQPRARFPTPKVNDTSRAPTDSSPTICTVIASCPLLDLLESLSVSFFLWFPVAWYNRATLQRPPTLHHGSPTTQAHSYLTSKNPPMCFMPPVDPATSKHTAAQTRFNASYTSPFRRVSPRRCHFCEQDHFLFFFL